MTLSLRQEVLYQHTVDLWEPVSTTDPVTKKRTGITHVLRASGVFCHFSGRQAVEANTRIGRTESDNFFTRDEYHFAEHEVVGAAWVIANRTVDFDGILTEHYGRYWVVQGRPKDVGRLGNRDAGKRICEVVESPRPPAVILTYYA